jgi:hypothetical protein
MSIREASAANVIATELVALAERGIAISPDLEHAAAVLLLRADASTTLDRGTWLIAGPDRAAQLELLLEAA